MKHPDVPQQALAIVVVALICSAVADVGTLFASGGYTIEQVGVDIDGETGGDNSGSSVSLSSDGSVLAIGAPSNGGNGDVSGSVRVYQWNTGDSRWTHLGSDIDGVVANDASGTSVSLSSVRSDGYVLARRRAIHKKLIC